jgi:hypothetical protein
VTDAEKTIVRNVINTISDVIASVDGAAAGDDSDFLEMALDRGGTTLRDQMGVLKDLLG